MILSDNEIKKAINKGTIHISPFTEANINPNSIDLTLGNKCKIYHPEAIPSNQTGIFNLEAYENYMFFNSDFTQNKRRLKLDCKKDNPTFEFEIPESGFVLQPNHLYLYNCIEEIGVAGNICATVMGKSSLGRLGLDIHVCAGFIDTGFKGSLVLEMRTIYPLRIYPSMKICQVKFESVTGVIGESYDVKKGSKYMNQSGVVSSQMHKNFNQVVVNNSSVDQSVNIAVNKGDIHL